MKSKKGLFMARAECTCPSLLPLRTVSSMCSASPVGLHRTGGLSRHGEA